MTHGLLATILIGGVFSPFLAHAGNIDTTNAYAWGGNAKWINVHPSVAGVPMGGVHMDNNGVFSGWAWRENIGWISFNCINTDTCGTVDFKVTTTWRWIANIGSGSASSAEPPGSMGGRYTTERRGTGGR